MRCARAWPLWTLRNKVKDSLLNLPQTAVGITKATKPGSFALTVAHFSGNIVLFFFPLPQTANTVRTLPLMGCCFTSSKVSEQASDRRRPAATSRPSANRSRSDLSVSPLHVSSNAITSALLNHTWVFCPLGALTLTASCRAWVLYSAARIKSTFDGSAWLFSWSSNALEINRIAALS